MELDEVKVNLLKHDIVIQILGEINEEIGEDDKQELLKLYEALDYDHRNVEMNKVILSILLGGNRTFR